MIDSVGARQRAEGAGGELLVWHDTGWDPAVQFCSVKVSPTREPVPASIIQAVTERNGPVNTPGH